GLEFAPAPCGQVDVTMDSPDQGAENLPVTSLALTGDSLRFAMDYLNGSFDGAVSADRRAITGSWTQGPGTLELRLTRGDTTTFRRPQEPEPPYPYDTLAVAYENAAGGVRFAGTLTLPRGDGPFPAVLMLTGSGAQNRDETVMGHRPFLILADYLTRRGIATLRVDDRGVGGSTGNVMTATIDDNAGDALAGVAFLERQPRVDGTRIGLLGHSEGGWVAPLAATRSSDVAFLVLLAGPAVSGEELLYAQDSVMSVLNGASPDHVAANRLASNALYAALRTEPSDSLAIPRMRAAVDSVVATLSAEQRRRLDSAWAGVDRDRAWQPLVTPWFRYLLSYDPRPVLARVTVPVLALFGEKDVQVPPSQSVPPMRAAFAAAGNRDATIHVIPGVNHLFQHAETGLIAEYSRIEETMTPAVLEEIATWIVQRFGRAGR
ncbi:MAG: alpha/beta fold hydrolase, partial [Gemmatimonadota bacterium]|nr:alpha/beta fold hydrolase [Gemmatimonadota bacterium]